MFNIEETVKQLAVHNTLTFQPIPAGIENFLEHKSYKKYKEAVIIQKIFDTESRTQIYASTSIYEEKEPIFGRIFQRSISFVVYHNNRIVAAMRILKQPKGKKSEYPIIMITYSTLHGCKLPLPTSIPEIYKILDKKTEEHIKYISEALIFEPEIEQKFKKIIKLIGSSYTELILEYGNILKLKYKEHPIMLIELLEKRERASKVLVLKSARMEELFQIASPAVGTRNHFRTVYRDKPKLKNCCIIERTDVYRDLSDIESIIATFDIDVPKFQVGDFLIKVFGSPPEVFIATLKMILSNPITKNLNLEIS